MADDSRLGGCATQVATVRLAIKESKARLETVSEEAEVTVIFDRPGALGITWEVDADSDDELGSSHGSGEITISAVLPTSMSADIQVLQAGMILKRLGTAEVHMPPMTFESIIQRISAHRSKDHPLSLTLRQPHTVEASRLRREKSASSGFAVIPVRHRDFKRL